MSKNSNIENTGKIKRFQLEIKEKERKGIYL
jgi:hypothetical protein